MTAKQRYDARKLKSQVKALQSTVAAMLSEYTGPEVKYSERNYRVAKVIEALNEVLKPIEVCGKN